MEQIKEWIVFDENLIITHILHCDAPHAAAMGAVPSYPGAVEGAVYCRNGIVEQ